MVRSHEIPLCHCGFFVVALVTDLVCVSFLLAATGFESLCRLPMDSRVSAVKVCTFQDAPIDDPGSQLLAFALRAQRRPSLKEMLSSFRQAMVRYDSSVPVVPQTPGYW